MLLAVLLVFFGILYLFSTRLMFRPLSLIQEKALQISTNEKNLGDEIPLPSGRELNELAIAFNSMSKSLRYYVENLEGLVKKRTAELTKANENLEMEIEGRKGIEETLRQEKEFAESLVDTAQAR
jgi:nitrate/nitrite-specific signal transduction histidine kinase